MRHEVVAELPGNIWKIEVEPGARVEPGHCLLVMETMKMEIPVHAETAALVAEVRVAPGDQVAAGDVLVVLAP
ncbi:MULTISPECIES: biotin/lipoyl-binding carrier protein [unclassified Nocardioides]|uniref:biotin/lipoyl-binding carrier protein n=1 Tax=unclassified Nocardioides TaxID=2615069 RepID=UPI000056FC99|nr:MULTISPECIES: biotin/lipoyl-binding carrier protein [unclassified Nocardioides]ABL83605.1 biotin/lipoyl attachment domain-containing protein [Nocardioides sp. JS614]MBI2242405.1 biotin/lipoyl-binding carrier protein [Nocardioides sp.]